MNPPDTTINTRASDVTEIVPSTPSPTSKASSNNNNDIIRCAENNMPMPSPKPVTSLTPQAVSPTLASASPLLKQENNTPAVVPLTPSPLKSSEHKTIIQEETPKTKKTRYTTRKKAKEWNIRYQEAKRFATKHGHCMIPRDYKENPGLSAWVKRQRYQYQIYQKNHQTNDGSHQDAPSSLSSSRTSAITPERIKLLEDIGFCWHHKDQKWWQRYQELVSFVEKRGHAIVPTYFEENQELAGWVKHQRRQYKLLYKVGKPSSMTSERVELLNKLGMVWAMKERNLDPNKKTKQPHKSSISMKRTVVSKSKVPVKKKKTATKRKRKTKYQKKKPFRVNRRVKNGVLPVVDDDDDVDSEADSVEAEQMERAASVFYPKSPPPPEDDDDDDDEDSWILDDNEEEDENHEPNYGQDVDVVVVETMQEQRVTDETEAVFALLSFGG